MTAPAPPPSAARPDDADNRPGRRRRLHALLISPGPDLRHLTGHHALALERLGAWCCAPRVNPVLVVLAVARPLAASSAGSMDVKIAPLERTTTSSLHPGQRRTGEKAPYGYVPTAGRTRTGSPARDRVAVQDRAAAGRDQRHRCGAELDIPCHYLPPSSATAR